jgi:hypothetical protein
MTLAEFKAWMDGFNEAVGDAPTPEQWQRITEKLATVHEPLPVLPQLPFGPPSYPTLPNIIGPYWSPTIPTHVPRFGEITCRNDMAFTATSSAAALAN